MMADDVVGHGHHNYLSTVAIVLQVLSTIFLALRLYSRFSRKSGKAGTDDAFLVVGWLFGTVLTIFAIIGSMHWGYDRHVFDVPVRKYSHAAFIGWLCELLFILATSINKVSVLLLFLRLINIFNNRNLLWAIRACLAFVVIFVIVFSVIPLAKCNPLSANWEMYDPTYMKPHHCITDRITWPVAAAFSSATDLAAVIIPLVILSGLRKPMKQKLGLYSVFAVGFIVVGAGIARTVLITRLVTQSVDFTWIGGLVILASLFEYHLALICACAPSLRHVFFEISTTISARRSEIMEKPRQVETPDSQKAIASPSLSEIHTAGLGSGAGGPRAMSPLVAVAYEPGHPGIPIHLDLTPQSPLSFPSAVFRRPESSALRNSGLSSRFTIWTGLRTTDSSTLDAEMGHSIAARDSIEDEVPEIPEFYRTAASPMMFARTSLQRFADPSSSSGFVACRGCGQYHEHGFRHGNEERKSGSGAWWRAGSVRSKWRRRESQSTFFMEEDESSSGVGSPPMSPR